MLTIKEVKYISEHTLIWSMIILKQCKGSFTSHWPCYHIFKDFQQFQMCLNVSGHCALLQILVVGAWMDGLGPVSPVLQFYSIKDCQSRYSVVSSHRSGRFAAPPRWVNIVLPPPAKWTAPAALHTELLAVNIITWRPPCKFPSQASSITMPGPEHSPLELQTKVMLRFPKISQSRKRPLLVLSHLRHY